MSGAVGYFLSECLAMFAKLLASGPGANASAAAFKWVAAFLLNLRWTVELVGISLLTCTFTWIAVTFRFSFDNLVKILGVSNFTFAATALCAVATINLSSRIVSACVNGSKSLGATASHTCWAKEDCSLCALSALANGNWLMLLKWRILLIMRTWIQ